MTEGAGQGVHGRKTNVSRVYDLLVENNDIVAAQQLVAKIKKMGLLMARQFQSTD